MDASDLYASTTLLRDPALDMAPCSPPKEPLPLSTPEAWWKGGKTLAARRRTKRISLRSINLTKTLAGMGDALSWKLSVLHGINAVR